MKFFSHEPNQPDHTRKIEGPEATVYFIPITAKITLFVSLRHKRNPARIASRTAYRITNAVKTALFSHIYDQDCDGTTSLVQDRLTSGKLVTYSDYNFIRVNGSMGQRLRILGKVWTADANNPAPLPRWTRPIIKAINL